MRFLITLPLFSFFMLSACGPSLLRPEVDDSVKNQAAEALPLCSVDFLTAYNNVMDNTAAMFAAQRAYTGQHSVENERLFKQAATQSCAACQKLNTEHPNEKCASVQGDGTKKALGTANATVVSYCKSAQDACAAGN